MTLDVREPSIVELTVRDRVQMDQLLPAQHGFVAERSGDLFGPGAKTLSLAKGFYCFRTLSDASLRVVSGGVDAAATASSKTSVPTLPAKGDDLERARGAAPGEIPSFTALDVSAGHGVSHAFRTLSDDSLEIVCGGLVAVAGGGTKDLPPPPAQGDPVPAPIERGDGCGETPMLTIEPRDSGRPISPSR